MARSRTSRSEAGEAPGFFDELAAEPREAPAKRSRKAAAAGERSPRHRLLLWLVVAFFLVVFVAAVALAYQVDTFLATDSRFSLASIERDGALVTDGSIQLVGLEYTQPEDVLELFRRDAGRSLYLLPLEQRRRELLAIDWVEDASVTRLWPNRLRVAIRERTPVVIAALAPRRSGESHQMVLADRAGFLMRLPRHAQFNLPIVFGLSLAQDVEFRASRIALLERMQTEVEPLDARFSELDVTDPRNLRATLTLGGRNVTLMLGNDRYLNRVQTFLDHYEAVLKANPRANLFDMRLEDQIVATREGLSGA